MQLSFESKIIEPLALYLQQRTKLVVHSLHFDKKSNKNVTKFLMKIENYYKEHNFRYGQFVNLQRRILVLSCSCWCVVLFTFIPNLHRYGEDVLQSNIIKHTEKRPIQMKKRLSLMYCCSSTWRYLDVLEVLIPCFAPAFTVSVFFTH